jgi:hypothetical protein
MGPGLATSCSHGADSISARRDPLPRSSHPPHHETVVVNIGHLHATPTYQVDRSGFEAR